jgi:hypothetical protein
MLKSTYKGRFLTMKNAYLKLLDWKSEQLAHDLVLHKYNGKKKNLKMIKILLLGANLKFNKLIVLVFKKGSESNWI